jgi:hypothetical protein
MRFDKVRRHVLAAMFAAVLAGGAIQEIHAETIAVDGGIAVKDPSIATPVAGMTMDEVTAKFGTPAQKLPAVGKPPISRWTYPGFIVYFEYNHVIHSVVANS